MCAGDGDQIAAAARGCCGSRTANPIATSAGAAARSVRIGAALAPGTAATRICCCSARIRPSTRREGQAEGVRDIRACRGAWPLAAPGPRDRRRDRRRAQRAAGRARVSARSSPPHRAPRLRGGAAAPAQGGRQRDGTAGRHSRRGEVGLIELLDHRVLDLALERLVGRPAKALGEPLGRRRLRSRDWLDRLKAALSNAVPASAERLDPRDHRDAGDRGHRGDGPAIAAHQGARSAGRDGRLRRRTFLVPQPAPARRRPRQDRRRFRAESRPLARRPVFRSHARRARPASRRSRRSPNGSRTSEAQGLLTGWGIDYLQGHAIGRAEIPENARNRRCARCRPRREAG